MENICEKCKEYGVNDCKSCNLGNPCWGCSDYDTWKGRCESEGACAHPDYVNPYVKEPWTKCQIQDYRREVNSNMSKYSDIEIQTAKNLFRKDYRWIVRYADGGVRAFTEKPCKNDSFWYGGGKILFVSGSLTPMFQMIKWSDDEPTYIRDIIYAPVLDDVEKEYLSAVIRPFRNKVVAICKETYGGDHDYQYIRIRFNDFPDTCLPVFESGTMYKGMDVGHEYSLEGLRL